MSVSDLEASILEAKSQGTDVRCLVVINPGNPTGQLLSYENMLEIVEFCDKYNLLLCADEVYQENIYVDQKEFHSFRCVHTPNRAVRASYIGSGPDTWVLQKGGSGF